MSQMPALARADLRTTAAPTRRVPAPARSTRSASRPVPGHLRLVTAAPRPARQMPFLVLCSIVLAGGLLVVLFLNMQLAKGSYALHDLQRHSTLLAENEARLTEHLAALESPGVLASKATKLGMVPGTTPAFLRLPDGQVLGVPQAAPTDPAAAPPATKGTATKDTATKDTATKGATKETKDATKATDPAAAKPSDAATTARTTKSAGASSSGTAAAKPSAAVKPSAAAKAATSSPAPKTAKGTSTPTPGSVR